MAGTAMERSIIFLIILGATLVSGCSTTTGTTVAGDVCPAPSNRSSEYLIGPGDTLNIVVWRDAELSATVPVRPDGRVSTPLVNDMQAAGKTPSELGADMEVVLAEYLRTPEVSVIVTGQGAANQIQVIGEVNNAQSISYRDGIKLLDVIVAAGGLSEFAAGNRASLVRQTEGGQVECRLKLKSLTEGDLSQNIDIYPGDVLVVPETRF